MRAYTPHVLCLQDYSNYVVHLQVLHVSAKWIIVYVCTQYIYIYWHG